MDVKEKIQHCLQAKYLLPVSAGSLLLVLIMRCIQLNVAIDYTTGFFTKSSWTMPLLLILIILFMAYAVAQILKHQFQIRTPYHVKNLKPVAIACCILGGVMMVSGFAQILGWSANTSDAKVMELLAMLFCIAGGGAFLYHGYLMLSRSEEKLQNHVLLAVAVIWSILNLMCNFIEHTTIASVSEYLFDFLFHIAAVLFLLYYAKFTAGIDSKNQNSYLLISGFLALFFGAVSSIAPLFCGAFWKLGMGQYFNPVSLALTVFVGFIMYLFVTDALRMNDSEDKAQGHSSVHYGEYQYESVRVGNLKRI